MDLDLTGKTAIVTGASRGIGLATVHTLIGEGVDVVAAARTITPALAATGATTIAADLSATDGVRTLIDAALEVHGGVDLLVNNVGGGDEAVMGFLDGDDTQWQRMFDINVLATVRATRAALPSLLERHGSIVNISSTVARMPAGVPASYGAVKAAVTALGKALSEEFGPQGVRVNTVSPGLVRTTVYEDPNGPVAQLAAASGVDLPTFVQQIAQSQNITTGRMSEPDEIAGLVAFLLSGRAANITGADYVIDGGTLKTV